MRATRFVITLLAVLAPGSALAMTTYVCCIHDRIEVDPRDPQEMRSDRGDAEICIIGPSFDFGPDATRWVEANLRAVGIHEPTMKTISRNDVRNGKPDPEPYLRAAWLTEIDPADAVVMEDSVTGATSGVAAGMRTIFWPQDRIDGPAGALVAHSVDEVRGLLGLD